MANRVSCPECAASLALGKIAPGQKVRCPKCKAVFAPREGPVEAATIAQVPNAEPSPRGPKGAENQQAETTADIPKIYPCPQCQAPVAQVNGLCSPRVAQDQVWDVSNGTVLRSFEGHTGSVTSVDFHPDGKSIASGSEDFTVRLWDANSGQTLRVLKGHTGYVLGIAFHPDGQHLGSCGTDETARIWDLTVEQDAQLLASPRGQAKYECAVMLPPRDSRPALLALGCSDGNIEVWDLERRQKRHELRGQAAIGCLAEDPASGRLYSASAIPFSVQRPGFASWNPDTGEEIQLRPDHAAGVVGMLAPPGAPLNATRWLCGPHPDAFLLSPLLQNITGLAFRPDGKQLAVLQRDSEMIRIASAITGERQQEIVAHNKPVRVLVYSPDGRYLASAGDDGRIKIWDVRTNAGSATLVGHAGPILALAYSPEGDMLASAGEDRVVRLWNPTSGAELQRLQGHTSSVRCLVFTPDGKRLISGSDDWTTKIWDPATGVETLTLKGHKNPLVGLAVNHDGTTLITAARDRTARIWTAPLKDQEREASGGNSGGDEVKSAIIDARRSPVVLRAELTQVKSDNYPGRELRYVNIYPVLLEPGRPYLIDVAGN